MQRREQLPLPRCALTRLANEKLPRSHARLGRLPGRRSPWVGKMHNQRPPHSAPRLWQRDSIQAVGGSLRLRPPCKQYLRPAQRTHGSYRCTAGPGGCGKSNGMSRPHDTAHQAGRTIAQPRGFPSAPLSRCRFLTVPKGVKSEKRSSSLHMVGTCAAQAVQPPQQAACGALRAPTVARSGARERPGSAIGDQLPLQRQQLVRHSPGLGARLAHKQPRL